MSLLVAKPLPHGRGSMTFLSYRAARVSKRSLKEGGGRSNKATSCRAEGIQHIPVAGDATAGASSAQPAVGSMFSATGWLSRTETWHCPQHSREENAGPEVSPCDACPCDLRQQLALLPLQQHDASLESAANARNGIGWANRNTTSANANQRAFREGITFSIRPKQAKTSVPMLGNHS
jgi:hypothetical protein